jgi:perosamine synthetase
MESNWLSMGPRTREFERIASGSVGRKFGIAVSNGTAALDVALKSLGVKSGDEVIVPAMAYIATGACVLYQHAKPVFVDIEPRTFNIDVKLVEKSITARTKAIVFMDFGGHPADLVRLRDIARKCSLFLIEDAAQSLGAERDGIRCGSAGHIDTTSFHLAKIVTTVEGGMVFTDEHDLATRARMIRNQGESGKYVHDVLGHNYRTTDINAAIGIEQFRRLEGQLAKRRRIARRYSDNLQGFADFQQVEDGVKHSWFFFLVLVEKRDQVVRALESDGIETRITYPLPLNKQKVFREFTRGEFPNAERFSRRVISLPMFPALKDEEIDQVCDVLVAAIKSARK